MTTVVIVESPTKARTITKFLPKTYKIFASMGHVRDLPQSASDIPEKYKKESWSTIGVNYEKDFEPLYIVPKDKKKVVKELKAELKNAEELILATDEDREGESISWHLLEVLKPKVPVKRMVFHEITKTAIKKALENCREVDMDLVKAQETRRILDRLVGYTLSPLLWKKIATGLSAGRVQSVSVRLLVMRERERRLFRKGTYWDIKAELMKAGKAFDSRLTSYNGKKIATGADFDENTGKLKKNKDVVLLDEKEARTLQNRLYSQDWELASLEEKPSVRKPYAPFITSTIQQEASRKLKFSPKKTMMVAQKLYEQGFITYMRTDSVNLSEQAVKAARSCVTEMYGKEYLSPKVRKYETKSKGAQEAHEAIRPAGDTFVHPADAGLSGDEWKLYDLIWKRTVATQMANAKLTHVKAIFKVDDTEFTSTGKRIDFPGYFRAYVEGSDDPNAALEDKEVILPDMKVGDDVKCMELEAKDHETKPPARYTEASLVKKLEVEGIGRPSTYATIIDTIVQRGYAQIVSNALIPSFTAFAITALLEENFNDLVDPGFTARMEQVLDDIAEHKAEWLPYMKAFYIGSEGLNDRVNEKIEKIEPGQYRAVDFGDITAKVWIGKYGPYIETEVDDKKITASVPKDLAPAEMNQEMVDLIVMQQAKSTEELGIHPDTSQPVYLLHGAYGPYVQLGETVEKGPKPKRVSLPKGIKESEVDMDTAVALLSLPREVGIHPDSEGKITAGISRYGSYILHDDPKNGKDFRSIPKDKTVIEITLEKAVEIFAKEKKARRKAAEPLREIGPHPVDGQPVNVYNGPYGPYVKYAGINAAIPKDINIEKLTVDGAIELIEAKQKAKLTRKRYR